MRGGGPPRLEMLLARVTGTLVATQKDRKLEGAKLLLVQPLTLEDTPRGPELLAVLLLFTAVAGPRQGYEWREVKRRGIDILFAVDTSRSMLAEDLKPNRLERARLGILDFIDKLNGDRIGLIPFAGSAFALCPLTTTATLSSMPGLVMTFTLPRAPLLS